MNTVIEFNPENPEAFSLNDLLVSLPISIVVKQRIYHLSFAPVVNEKDEVEYRTSYRCQSNSTQFVSTAPSPKESLVHTAKWLLSKKIVTAIKKETNE